jgi:hypothetical protein
MNTAEVEPHPSSETLVRFAEGTSRRKETREVVRHLLRGCRACSVLAAGQVSTPVDEDAYEPIFRRAQGHGGQSPEKEG